MPIEFSCPNCQKAYRVGDANAGKRFACKECGQPVEVPAAGEQLPQDSGPQVQAPQQQQRAPLQKPKLPGGKGPGGPRLPGGPRPGGPRPPGGGPRPPGPQPMGAPGGHPPQPYGQQGYGPPMKPHRGTAVLILGILSWVVCGLCAIPGLIMGGADLKQMRSGVMDRSGEGMTKAGYYLSMVAVIFMVLGLVMFLVLIVFASSAAPPPGRTQYEHQQQPRRYSTLIP